jgi:hypothetical protein
MGGKSAKFNFRANFSLDTFIGGEQPGGRLLPADLELDWGVASRLVAEIAAESSTLSSWSLDGDRPGVPSRDTSEAQLSVLDAKEYLRGVR